jgi:hypothetical protein
MITAYRKKIIVRPDGRIEISDPILKPGTEAEVIVLVENSPESEEMRLMRVRDWEILFKETQALPIASTMTEEEIVAEIVAYRAEKNK